MDKFWKWMDENDYGRWVNDTEWGICDVGGEPMFHTKQMLIGYMIEYCVKVLDWFSFNFDYYSYKTNSINEIYDELEKEINQEN